MKKTFNNQPYADFFSYTANWLLEEWKIRDKGPEEEAITLTYGQPPQKALCVHSSLIQVPLHCAFCYLCTFYIQCNKDYFLTFYYFSDAQDSATKVDR